MSVGIEKIDEALDYKTIIKIPTPKSAKYFQRNRFFKIGEYEYRIEWYTNQSTLYAPGNITVLFDDIERRKTWPHNSKMDLIFCCGDNVVAVLKIK